MAEVLVKEHQLPVRRACQIVKLSRAAYYRRPQCATTRDAEVIEALNEIVAKRSRWGFWKCFGRLRLEGRPWNHKRVHRVYCAMRLNLPRRTKKRLPARIEVGTSIPSARVIRVLERLIEIYGRPQALRLDNGPEFTAAGFGEGCQERGIALPYIEPGKPD